MGWAAEIGSPHVAAPPVGATGGMSKRDDPKFTQPVIDLLAAADRYRALAGTRQVDGRDANRRDLGLLEDAAPARRGAAASRPSAGETKACVLPDVYHLYKGGSDFAGLGLLAGNAIGIFHVNDYPKIDRDKITDADRVYPGDGIAPLKEVFASLRKIGLRGLCLAGTVQSRLLEARPAHGREDRTRQDEGRDGGLMWPILA